MNYQKYVGLSAAHDYVMSTTYKSEVSTEINSDQSVP